jgi:hypothetical protein
VAPREGSAATAGPVGAEKAVRIGTVVTKATINEPLTGGMVRGTADSARSTVGSLPTAAPSSGLMLPWRGLRMRRDTDPVHPSAPRDTVGVAGGSDADPLDADRDRPRATSIDAAEGKRVPDGRPVTDPKVLEAILGQHEQQVARVTRRTLRRLMRLALRDRWALDPYGLLLRRPGEAWPPRD